MMHFRVIVSEEKSKKQPHEIWGTALLFSFLTLFLSLNLKVLVPLIPFSKSFRNELTGLAFLATLVSFIGWCMCMLVREKVPTLKVPEMTIKASLVAYFIRRKFTPVVLKDLLKIEVKTEYGWLIPEVKVYVDPSYTSGWVAIENLQNANRLDRDKSIQDLSGILKGFIVQKFAFINSELTRDGNFYIYHFEDVKTSQRLIVKNGDLKPFISTNSHCLRLAKDLIWKVDGSTPHLSIIGHTRSGKSFFTGHYLLPLMILQNWQVEFFSVKNDIYVDKYHGQFEPIKIIERLEYWEKVMKKRNADIKKAGMEKYSQMEEMPDIALVIDEIGSLNGALSMDRKLKARWEAVIGSLTATGASSGIHIVALNQYGTRESFLPTTARANVTDAVIMLGSSADSAIDRQYLMPGFEIPHRDYDTGQGIARIVSAGRKWESPHFYETPLILKSN